MPAANHNIRGPQSGLRVCLQLSGMVGMLLGIVHACSFVVFPDRQQGHVLTQTLA